MRPILLLYLTLLLWGAMQPGYSQTASIDSLQQLLGKAPTKQQQLSLLLQLCAERQSMQNDRLIYYATTAGEISKQLGLREKALEASFYLNNGLLKNGKTSLVIDSCNQQLTEIDAQQFTPTLKLNLLYLKGLALVRSSQYKEAMAVAFSLLQSAEKSKDTAMQIKGKNIIGWAYMEMGQYHNSINWFHKALATTPGIPFHIHQTYVYNNIASCYNNVQQYDSALYFVNKNLEPPNESDLNVLANAQNIKADIYLNLGKKAAAQQLLEKALEVRKRIGDAYYIISDIYQLSIFYSDNGQPARGIATAKEGIDMANTFGVTAKLPLLYEGLAKGYLQAGDLGRYAAVLKQLLVIKDSLFERNSAEALADLQTKYDVQKKENIIIQQQLAILKKDYFITGLILTGLLVLLIGFVVYNNYKTRQKIKMEKLLVEQKTKESHAVMEAEENQRRHIAAELHDNLGAQISFINSNIDWMIDSPTALSNEEQKKRLQLITDTSHSLMRTLRETIWALNRDKINIEEFSDKLKAYIQTYLQIQPGTHFSAKEAIDEKVVLTPVEALNIFRIYQEAVNNAIKYAKADNLLLHIAAGEQHFSIQLTDDGVGFNETEVNGEHFGLQNMRARAAETRYTLNITSQPGKGTSIKLSGAIVK